MLTENFEIDLIKKRKENYPGKNIIEKKTKKEVKKNKFIFLKIY